jgi:hypothetical protein
MRRRLFAVRVTAPPPIGDGDVGVRWEVPGSDALSSGIPKAGDRPVAPGVRGAVVGLPEGLTVGTVRVGLGVRPRNVMASSQGSGVMGVGTPGGGVVFSRARAIPNGSCIAISEVVGDKEVRIVAIDRDGVEHAPSSESTVSARSARMHDLEFPVTPDRLREVRVLTRPYDWAEFRDIALDPTAASAK